MKQLQQETSRCVSTIMKPLRIFQFFAMLLLFAFTIYMIVMDPVPINAPVCILLIVLSGVYVFVLAIELISHFAGSALHIIPMTIFSLLGFIFFGIVGLFLIFYAFTQLVVQIIVIILCLLAALLFLIDITMIFAFWKRRCEVCKRCCNNSTAELLLHKGEEPSAPETEVLVETNMTKHDVTTSLSDVRVPDELKGVVTPDHCYRKVEYPRRREYVDCATCVPSLCNIGVAQIQTETKMVSIVESQTPIAITQETPVQTTNKCEFCQQQLSLVEGADAPCLQLLSQWSYPAIVQFVRGGANIPCCFGCKCSTAQTQQQQEPQKLTQQRTELPTPKVNSNSSKTSTSETTQQVASKSGIWNYTESGNDDVKRLNTTQPITSYTVASSYDPDKRMQTVPDIAYNRKMDTTKIKEDVKSINKNIDQKFSEETTMNLAKSKRPEQVGETNFERIDVKKRNENDAERNEEGTTIEVNKKVKRSKGGGEHCTRIYQEFMRAEQGSVTNLEESHTSGTLLTPLSSRTKPRTLLHLKSNKVDPVKDENVVHEAGTLEKALLRMAFDNQAAQESEHPARIGSPSSTIEHQFSDACSFCRQKSLTPTLDNSMRYIVFKDKNGKYFCEFCAPLDSKKITSRLEGTDLRKLRCTNCRLSLRDRGVRTNVKLKSDTCPKCGRSQRHAASPSST